MLKGNHKASAVGPQLLKPQRQKLLYSKIKNILFQN